MIGLYAEWPDKQHPPTNRTWKLWNQLWQLLSFYSWVFKRLWDDWEQFSEGPCFWVWILSHDFRKKGIKTSREGLQNTRFQMLNLILKQRRFLPWRPLNPSREHHLSNLSMTSDSFSFNNVNNANIFQCSAITASASHPQCFWELRIWGFSGGEYKAPMR